ncbi:MAG: PHB depolymerase family esterase [Planctomycetota bacterium]
MQNATRILAALLTLPLLLATARSQASDLPLELRSVLTADGLRWYRVAFPEGHDPSQPAPLAVLFHGGGGNAVQAAEAYGVVAEGLERGYVVAVPEGTGKFAGPPLFKFETWNGGGCCGYAQQNGIDDVAFFEALVDVLARDEGIDRGRVFATGFSNGAIMTYRIAAERPDLVRAVAPVGGSFEGPLPPTVPVPLFANFGLLDESIPFEGGVGDGVSGFAFSSQIDSVTPFLIANGGTPPPPLNLEQAVFYYAVGGPGGADTAYYLQLDGGHTWPGGQPSPIDPTTPQHTALGATELMFDFFELQSALD